MLHCGYRLVCGCSSGETAEQRGVCVMLKMSSFFFDYRPS